MHIVGAEGQLYWATNRAYLYRMKCNQHAALILSDVSIIWQKKNYKIAIIVFYRFMHVQSSNDLTKQWYKIYQYSITISSIILYHITLYYIMLYYLINLSLTIYVKKSRAGLSLFHICSMYMYLPLTIYSVMNAQVISESLWCKRKQDVSINIQLEKFICELIKSYLQKAIIILNS